jgi:hypothetical protein
MYSRRSSQRFEEACCLHLQVYTEDRSSVFLRNNDHDNSSGNALARVIFGGEGVTGSNFGLETVIMIEILAFLSTPKQMLGQYPKLGPNRLILRPYQIIIY